MDGLAYALEVKPYVDNVEVLAGDALRLPFADEAFDACFCNSSIEHFPDDGLALMEIARVLKDQGRLILTTDSFPPTMTRLASWMPERFLKAEIRDRPRREAAQQFHRRVNHVVNYYTPESLCERLESNGFDVIEKRSYLAGFFPRFVFEAHLLMKGLDFYNSRSQRLYPLFHPFSFLDRADRPGYGVASLAVKRRGR